MMEVGVMGNNEMSCSQAAKLSLDPFSVLTMMYTADGFEELKKDIVMSGQLVQIILRDSKSLDGGHRHRACTE